MSVADRFHESSRSQWTYGRRQTFNGDGQRRSERTTFRIGRELNHSRYSANAEEDPSTYRQSPESPRYQGY